MKKVVVIFLSILVLSSCVTTLDSGVSKQNINIVTAAGPQHTSFVTDLNPVAKRLSDSATTFIEGDATIKNIKSILSSNDDLKRYNVLILTGHGMEDEMAIAEDFPFDELLAMCEATPQADIVLIDACFSGSIRFKIDEDDEDIVVITSAARSVATSGNEQVGLTKSVSVIFTDPKIADHNGDGVVTAGEFYDETKAITDQYLQSSEWLEQAEHWNQHPNSEYGIFGNRELVLFNL